MVYLINCGTSEHSMHELSKTLGELFYRKVFLRPGLTFAKLSPNFRQIALYLTWQALLLLVPILWRMYIMYFFNFLLRITIWGPWILWGQKNPHILLVLIILLLYFNYYEWIIYITRQCVLTWQALLVHITTCYASRRYLILILLQNTIMVASVL